MNFLERVDMRKLLFRLLPAMVLVASCFAADKPMKDKAYDDAAATEASNKLEFANTWAQNGPYTMDGLKGKLVVLYFYVDT